MLGISSHYTSVAALFALLGHSICCPSARTQTAGTGALGGNITDPSGASVAGAYVKVMGKRTGETRTVSSAAEGRYAVGLLLPGLYELEVAQSGFKTARFMNVRVAVAEIVTLNVRLEIGAM